MATTILVSLTALSAGPLHGQSVVSVGGEVANFAEETTALVGLRAASANPGGPGVDVGLQIIPRFLGDGALAMLGDLGLAFNVPLGEGALLAPRVGGTTALLLGSGGGGGEAGLGAGVALVLAEPGSRGLRLDVTYRRIGDDKGFFGFSAGVAWRKGGP